MQAKSPASAILYRCIFSPGRRNYTQPNNQTCSRHASCIIHICVSHQPAWAVWAESGCAQHLDSVFYPYDRRYGVLPGCFPAAPIAKTPVADLSSGHDVRRIEFIALGNRLHCHCHRDLPVAELFQRGGQAPSSPSQKLWPYGFQGRKRANG